MMVDLGAAPNAYEAETWGNRARSVNGSALYDPPLWEYRANAPRPVTAIDLLNGSSGIEQAVTPGEFWDDEALQHVLARTVNEAVNFRFFHSYLYEPRPGTGRFFLSDNVWHDSTTAYDTDLELHLRPAGGARPGCESLTPYFEFDGDVVYQYLDEAGRAPRVRRRPGRPRPGQAGRRRRRRRTARVDAHRHDDGLHRQPARALPAGRRVRHDGADDPGRRARPLRLGAAGRRRHRHEPRRRAVGLPQLGQRRDQVERRRQGPDPRARPPERRASTARSRTRRSTRRRTTSASPTRTTRSARPGTRTAQPALLRRLRLDVQHDGVADDVQPRRDGVLDPRPGVDRPGPPLVLPPVGGRGARGERAGVGRRAAWTPSTSCPARAAELRSIAGRGDPRGPVAFVAVPLRRRHLRRPAGVAGGGRVPRPRPRASSPARRRSSRARSSAPTPSSTPTSCPAVEDTPIRRASTRRRTRAPTQLGGPAPTSTCPARTAHTHAADGTMIPLESPGAAAANERALAGRTASSERPAARRRPAPGRRRRRRRR